MPQLFKLYNFICLFAKADLHLNILQISAVNCLIVKTIQYRHLQVVYAKLNV